MCHRREGFYCINGRKNKGLSLDVLKAHEGDDVSFLFIQFGCGRSSNIANVEDQLLQMTQFIDYVYDVIFFAILCRLPSGRLNTRSEN